MFAYINEQNVSSHLQKAVLAVYVLTHKTVFSDKPHVPPYPLVPTKNVIKDPCFEPFFNGFCVSVR